MRLNPPGFSARLRRAWALLAVLALVQGAVAVWSVESAARQVQRGRVASDLLGGLLEMATAKKELRLWMAGALLGGEAPQAQRDALLDRLDSRLVGLRTLDDTARQLDGDLPPGERTAALAQLGEAIGLLRRDLRAPQALAPGLTPAVAWAQSQAQLERSDSSQLRALLAGRVEAEQAAVRAKRMAADRSLARARGLGLGATACLAAAAALLALYFSRALRRPLQALDEGAQALQRGELGYRIALAGDDEFARLAARVNAMAGELQQRRAQEAGERQHLEALVAERTTELRRALADLTAQEECRRQLLADISHELRTPTTAIRGEAEIALRGKLADDPAARRDTLLRIADAARHLGSVIDDLLTLARSDAEGLRLALTPLDGAEVLAQAVAQVHGTAAERGLTLSLDANPAAPVAADAQRLRQGLVVLIDNAVRYSHPGGRVRVAAEVAGGRWQVSVQDEGIGIAADALPAVFERHYRSPAARRHRADGSGLGLPLARLLARAHGGEVVIDSREGQGCTARVSLPLREGA